MGKTKQKGFISIFPNYKHVSHHEGQATERKRRQQNNPKRLQEMLKRMKAAMI